MLYESCVSVVSVVFACSRVACCVLACGMDHSNVFMFRESMMIHEGSFIPLTPPSPPLPQLETEASAAGNFGGEGSSSLIHSVEIVEVCLTDQLKVSGRAGERVSTKRGG